MSWARWCAYSVFCAMDVPFPEVRAGDNVGLVPTEGWAPHTEDLSTKVSAGGKEKARRLRTRRRGPRAGAPWRQGRVSALRSYLAAFILSPGQPQLRETRTRARKLDATGSGRGLGRY